MDTVSAARFRRSTVLPCRPSTRLVGNHLSCNKRERRCELEEAPHLSNLGLRAPLRVHREYYQGKPVLPLSSQVNDLFLAHRPQLRLGLILLLIHLIWGCHRYPSVATLKAAQWETGSRLIRISPLPSASARPKDPFRRESCTISILQTEEPMRFRQVCSKRSWSGLGWSAARSTLPVGQMLRYPMTLSQIKRPGSLKRPWRMACLLLHLPPS